MRRACTHTATSNIRRRLILVLSGTTKASKASTSHTASSKNPLKSSSVCAQARSGQAEPAHHHGKSEPFRLHRSRATYERDVQACKDALYEGESYELCLTTALSCKGPVPDALHLYYTLRQHSPAPYAAFLSFGDGGPQVSTFPHPMPVLKFYTLVLSSLLGLMNISLPSRVRCTA